MERELVDGITTKEIYHKAFELLHKEEKPIALKYSLKRAIMELGPSGFPFEKFVAEIFKFKGYTAETGKLVKGFCVEHEVDVVAWNKDKLIMCEAKFHNDPGMKSDLKVALYVKARFDDLRKMTYKYGKERKLDEIRDDQKYGLLETDEDGNFIDFKSEAYDEYDIHTADNTPDLDALTEALEWGFDPATLDDVKDVKDYEYYAVFAICFLADYARTLEFKLQLNPIGWVKREKGTYEPSEVAQLGKKLFEAIEAVCFAERLRAVDRVEQKYQAKIEKLLAGAAVRITAEDYERMRDEIKRDL